MRGEKEGKERDQKIDDRGGKEMIRDGRGRCASQREKKAGVCAWLHGLRSGSGRYRRRRRREAS